MSIRNANSVRRTKRRGKTVLIIDFRYVDKSGRQRRYRHDASVQTMTAAVAEAERLKRMAAEHGTLDVKKDVPSLAKFVDDVFEPEFMPRYKPSTADRYRALLRQGVRAELGRLPLDEVSPAGVRAFAAKLKARGVELKGPLTFVKTIMNAAVEANAIQSYEPFPKLWKESKKLPEAPTMEEVTTLLAKATGWIRIAIALAAFGGLRSGEVRAVEVQDIDLVANVIRIRRAFSHDKVLTPKSNHDRVVPMAPQLREILAEAVKMKLPKARVVVNERGHTPTRQSVLTTLKRVEEKHGLRAWSYHALRHFFCSALVRLNVPVEAVRVLAGHNDLATTQRYVHAEGRDLTAAVAKLG